MTEQKSEQTVTKDAAHECAEVRWRSCSVCGGDGEVFLNTDIFEKCELCQETGLRFPGLSEECWKNARKDDWCNGPYEKKPSLRVYPGERLRAQSKCLTCGQSYSRRQRTYAKDAPHLPECRCQGRGRLPVDTLEAWLKAVETMGDRWELARHKDGYYFDFGNVGPSPTPIAAIQQAICTALGAHSAIEEADAAT